MGLDELRGHVTRIPPWGWVALVGVAGLGALVWHHWAINTPDNASWLDPEQPAVKLPDAPPANRARGRDYPGSLIGWSGCVIGDC